MAMGIRSLEGRASGDGCARDQCVEGRSGSGIGTWHYGITDVNIMNLVLCWSGLQAYLIKVTIC